MIRIERGNVGQKRRKKIIKLAKNFVGASSRLFKIASQKVMKSFIFTYSSLKRRTRFLKKNWICRINGATRQGLFPIRTSSYNKLRSTLKKCKSKLNAKILSQLSILDILSFYKALWILNPGHVTSYISKNVRFWSRVSHVGRIGGLPNHYIEKSWDDGEKYAELVAIDSSFLGADLP